MGCLLRRWRVVSTFHGAPWGTAVGPAVPAYPASLSALLHLPARCSQASSTLSCCPQHTKSCGVQGDAGITELLLLLLLLQGCRAMPPRRRAETRACMRAPAGH